LMHNAKVIALEGNFDDALNLVKTISEKYPIKLINSINSHRIEGQKTAAFEVCEQLENEPDYLVIPVGNAGNITSYWKGFNEFMGYKKIKKLPKMVGFQAEGAAPIVKGAVVKDPKTVATAIRIGSPARWKEAEAAVKESAGRIDTVNDEQIIDAYRMLAVKEGIFVEPASAASVAGILKLNKQNYFTKGSKIVCICTGHGLKDPDCAIKSSPKPVDAPNDLKKIVDLIFNT